MPVPPFIVVAMFLLIRFVRGMRLMNLAIVAMITLAVVDRMMMVFGVRMMVRMRLVAVNRLDVYVRAVFARMSVPNSLTLRQAARVQE